VHAHIARHAAAQPEAVAVICGEQTLRYGELLDRADRLAAVLHARGIGTDDRVGIALSRWPDIIVALLAVMRAGAAYVPFDPAYPRDRLAYLFDDSAIRLLITEPALLDTLPAPAALPVLTLDMVPADVAPLAEVAVHPDQLAYVIYTSGSTGRPKGVCVAHGPLAMHVAATIDAYEMGKHSRELHFLSFAFDGAHERWLCALACGGSLVLRDDALWTPEQTATAMVRHGVTNAGFPPAYLRQLAEYCEQTGQHPPVSLYSFGGEAMSRGGFAQARRALGAQTYINGYGPTETVVTPMVWKVRADDSAADFPGTYAPIGRPVGDRCCYLLDAELNLVPPGVAGELYIGGEGLARGYLNRPGMTAERFIPDPFADTGARLYRTGDLARWLPDGQLEYLGRIDQQLKIRGFRIEPGEIEARIAAQPDVAEAAVLAVEGPSGARLAAYVVATGGATVDVHAIRRALTAELPDYMVPAAFVVLDALPLTPNGKLDRRALPAPEADRAEQYVAPRSAAQRWLAGLWQDVLGVDRVGLDDNFFTLGGDSLLSLKVISRVRANKAMGIDLKLRDLMRTPTIGQLLPDGVAASADSASAAPPTALRVLAQGPTGGTLPPVACVHAALGTLFDYDAIVAQLGSERTVYGFQSRTLVDPGWQEISPAAIAADYVREWRAVQPQGPYLLLGWSLGATLATWMARELEAQGQAVQWLGLVDPFVPEAATASERPGWPAALEEFAARLLPGAGPLVVPASVAPAPDAAGVSALLAPLVASAPAPSAALGADELAQMFVAAHRLGALMMRESTVPVVQAPRSVWWRTGRDNAAARLAGWQGAPWRETVLDGVDHHAIVGDARLLADLGPQLATCAQALRDRHTPLAPVDTRPATLPT
ncbi:amino acid adenylation domain-containing protein, partial [Ralstonia sp. 25mfcol4.1]|uniref:amino acid adenylation domain-containing protein n=1 Tax=Ralstonia sp. 25mfcol4.1 TaxID=1761899 RepID=UPI001113A7F7